MGSRWMCSFWYQTCRNMLRNTWVLIIWTKTMEMKNCNCYHSLIYISRLSLVLYSWMASFAIFFFQTYLSLFKWLELLIFVNGFLQVWYQNEQDIHLLLMIYFFICLIWIISGQIRLLEVFRNFFCWVYLFQWIFILSSLFP